MPESENLNRKMTNYIDSDVVFNGTIEFEDKLVVSGLIFGEIIGKSGDLEITKQGEFQGKSAVNSLQNRGKISGQTSAQTAYLFTSSISHSDFDVSEIVVETKAIVNGKIVMPLDQPPL